MKKIFLIACLLLLPATTWAVDGYKDLKFGMSKAAIKKSKICKFTDYDIDVKDIAGLYCNNFVFNGSQIEAYAFFIDNKFLRFVITPPINMLDTIGESLEEKYGPPTGMSSKDELDAVDKFPDRKAFVAFKKGAVVLKISSSENGTQGLSIVYQSPEYERLLTKKQKVGMKDSL